MAIEYGDPMGTTGGVNDSVYERVRDCWLIGQYDTNDDNVPDMPIDTDGNGWPDQPWELKLPVIQCPDPNVGPCSIPDGAVVVNVVWITQQDRNQMREVPRQMGNWSCPSTYSGQACWDSFVQTFQLMKVLDGVAVPATYENETIYFLPDCTPHEPSGLTGGENYGVLARVPVLVR